jgi:hypothetical protein
MSAGKTIIMYTINQCHNTDITGSIPLLVDYYYHWVYTSAGGLLLSLGLYLCWWTIIITGSIPLLVDYYYHWVYLKAK